MSYDFDRVINRRASDSGKWNTYDAEVLPLWVADMDFAVAEPIVNALQERVAHGVFGYGYDSPALLDVLVQRMDRLYGWQITRSDIVLLPGLVSGLNVMARAVGQPGDGVLVNTPVYGPFLSAPLNQGRSVQSAPQHATERDRILHYTADMDALEAALRPETRLFYLCNPHNPTGRAWTRPELGQFAALAERHDLILCSDEIHCDLLLDGQQHIPVASLSPEIAQRSVTLMAPSKTFNIPGLGASFAIVQNKALRTRVQESMAGIVPHINLLGAVAMHAAYAECDEWLANLRTYLGANRDLVVRFVREQLPQVRTTCPEATYLAWLDLNDCGIEGSPQNFLLKTARLAVNEGAWFGEGGEGFVRLNFGCPRSTLLEALERLRGALETR